MEVELEALITGRRGKVEKRWQGRREKMKRGRVEKE